jgi:hypothetical protein
MTWFDVVKIKNPAGELLLISDVNEFISLLRHVLVDLRGTYGTTHKTRGERKSNVVVKETYLTDPRLRTQLKIVASIRHPQTSDREYYEIILAENEEGDFYFATARGPNIHLTINSVIPNEFELIRMISDAVKRDIEFKIRESKDLRDVSGEDRQTAAQVRQDVEAANPGYIMIRQKLYKIDDLREKAKERDITYEQLLSEMGYDESKRTKQ